MLYIINSIRLIKPVNNEVGHDDNKVGRSITDYVFALKTDWRFQSYVVAALLPGLNSMTSSSTRSVYPLISHQMDY